MSGESFLKARIFKSNISLGKKDKQVRFLVEKLIILFSIRKELVV